MIEAFQEVPQAQDRTQGLTQTLAQDLGHGTHHSRPALERAQVAAAEVIPSAAPPRRTRGASAAAVRRANISAEMISPARGAGAGGAPASTVAPRPFLKWAGGKRQLLPELLARLPGSFRRYHEPFLGGGALFFALAERGHEGARGAVLSDVNPELVNAYQVVRDRVETLITLLGAFRNEEEFYYEVREQDPSRLDPVQRAARLIYLNKTCFNGLFRENRHGRFNVPFGRYRQPLICAPNELRAASKALRGASIERRPFEAALELASPGDFVYCDPPYAPISRTASFTGYTGGGFDETAQRRLADRVRALGDAGVHVLVSNSWVPLTQSLYDGLRVEKVLASRAINSRGDRRGKVPELLAAAGPAT
jgi:DNA adenine methylase